MTSDDEAKRLAKDLSDQHPLAVYGMAKTFAPSGFKITSALVTAVNEDGCQLRIACCRGDLCQMKTPTYEFRTPLESAKDLSDKIINEIIPDVCAPNILWLVTDPLALLILVVCGLLGFGTYIGVENMTEGLMGAPQLDKTIGTIFGSSRNLAHLVVGSFWFAIVAHVFEACLVVYYATKWLPTIPNVSKGIWAFMVFLVGYPVFSRFQGLVAIQQEHAKSK
mmetsp:Transcript_6108/g.14831  ORF Transcript_6108/g.14831 Transcript_6108/m.14831 type:complete len:222 (+) Transcript_6108:60-725(+)